MFGAMPQKQWASNPHFRHFGVETGVVIISAMRCPAINQLPCTALENHKKLHINRFELGGFEKQGVYQPVGRLEFDGSKFTLTYIPALLLFGI